MARHDERLDARDSKNDGRLLIGIECPPALRNQRGNHAADGRRDSRIEEVEMLFLQALFPGPPVALQALVLQPQGAASGCFLLGGLGGELSVCVIRWAWWELSVCARLNGEEIIHAPHRKEGNDCNCRNTSHLRCKKPPVSRRISSDSGIRKTRRRICHIHNG